MSLDHKPLGNPNWGKGKPSANPFGRPKGPTKKTLDVKRRILLKWNTHPVDKLVRIANFVEATNPDLCAKIWLRILDSCELEERKNKNSLPPITEAAETTTEADALKILEEIENGRAKEAIPPSNSNGLETRETNIQTETSSTEDIPSDQGK
jgi:hypothetical protein